MSSRPLPQPTAWRDRAPWAALGVGLLLLAALVVRSAGDPAPCTLIGCDSAVVFDIVGGIDADTTYEFEICADGDCRSDTAGRGAGVPGLESGLEIDPANDTVSLGLGDRELAGEHHVTMELVADDRRLIASFDDVVPFTRQEPNGPNCPPACWLARLPV